MKLILKSVQMFLLLLAPALALHQHEVWLDVDREQALFEAPKYRSEGTYEDSIDIRAETTINMGMGETTVSQAMTFVMSTTVIDLKEGGQEIDATVTEFVVDIDSPMGISVHCDLKDDENKDEEEEEEPKQEDALSSLMSLVGGGGGDALCAPYRPLLDATTSLIVDDEGTVAEQEEEGTVPDKVKDLASPAKSVTQTSRMLKFLPSIPVEPHDKWDIDVELDEGHFTGSAKLDGYLEYDGHDCAVIVTEGQFEMDLEGLMEKFGLGDVLAAVGSETPTIKDFTMIATEYWDNEEKLVRWSNSKTSFTLELSNPFDSSRMELPVEEEITTTSAKKE